MKNVFSKNFLWGGATAAHQYEGGVGSCGLSVPDVMSGGSRTTLRYLTDGILPGYYTPATKSWIFITAIKRTLPSTARWASKCSA